jgi:hypothetical protein
MWSAHRKGKKMLSDDTSELYYLYLEGLANEVMHILQQHRKKLGLAIMDDVDVCLVQTTFDKLTSSIYCFIDAIIERVRIIDFYPNPHFSIEPQACKFTCCFGHTYTFDIYMQKRI